MRFGKIKLQPCPITLMRVLKLDFGLITFTITYLTSLVSFALIFTQFWWLLFKTLRLMFMLYFLLSSLNSVLGNLKLNFILSFLTSEIKFHPLFIISLPKEIYRRVLYCLVNYKLAK